jgi:DNA-binding cell septation regulator SpoVG
VAASSDLLNWEEGKMVDQEIRIRTWVRGSDDDVRSGLLGFVSVYYGQLVIDGIVVRRTAEGRLTLSFPERRDRHGGRHPYVRPVDDAARKEIEKAVFGAATIAEAVQR